MFGTIFAAALVAYLTGWLLVNLLFNRILARATKNQERLDQIKAQSHKQFAAAVVDELENRATAHTPWQTDDLFPTEVPTKEVRSER